MTHKGCTRNAAACISMACSAAAAKAQRRSCTPFSGCNMFSSSCSLSTASVPLLQLGLQSRRLIRNYLHITIGTLMHLALERVTHQHRCSGHSQVCEVTLLRGSAGAAASAFAGKMARLDCCFCQGCVCLETSPQADLQKDSRHTLFAWRGTCHGDIHWMNVMETVHDGRQHQRRRNSTGHASQQQTMAEDCVYLLGDPHRIGDPLRGRSGLNITLAKFSTCSKMPQNCRSFAGVPIAENNADNKKIDITVCFLMRHAIALYACSASRLYGSLASDHSDRISAAWVFNLCFAAAVDRNIMQQIHKVENLIQLFYFA